MIVSESLDDLLKPKQLTPAKQKIWDKLKWKREVYEWMEKLGLLKFKRNLYPGHPHYNDMSQFRYEIDHIFFGNESMVDRLYFKNKSARSVAKILLKQL